MQAIKEKLSDMSAMRKAKAEAKEEENEEKELAKARMDVAHEARKAREAEAEMDLHVNKAAQKAEGYVQKHAHHAADDHDSNLNDPSTHDPSYGGGADGNGCETGEIGSTAAPGYTSGPPTHNKFL